MEAGGPGPRQESQLSKASGSSKKALKPAIPKQNVSPAKDNFENVMTKANRELDKASKEIQKSKNRMYLSRLDQLKFKMEIQNKNLRLLTGQNDIMSGVYTDERLSK